LKLAYLQEVISTLSQDFTLGRCCGFIVGCLLITGIHPTDKEGHSFCCNSCRVAYWKCGCSCEPLILLELADSCDCAARFIQQWVWSWQGWQ